MIILRQKEFARQDYEGLDEISKANLRRERSELAKELNESRNRGNKTLERKLGNLKTATDIHRASFNNTENLGSSFYNNVEGAHGKEVRQMVGDLMTNKNPEVLKKDIYMDRNALYNKELRNIKDDSDMLKRNELKRTKGREFKEAARREEAVRRAAKSKDSIARHEAKAAELRAKKKTGEILKKGGKIALATGGVVAAGYGAKKLYDKKNQK